MTITFDEYDKICSIFNEMPITAESYVPPKTITNRYFKNEDTNLMLYGLWLEETNTVESNEDTRALNKAINNTLTISD